MISLLQTRNSQLEHLTHQTPSPRIRFRVSEMETVPVLYVGNAPMMLHYNKDIVHRIFDATQVEMRRRILIIWNSCLTGKTT
jgi:hypothetical protein